MKERVTFKSVIYLLTLGAILCMVLSSCKKEPTVTWRVNYVLPIEVQDNPKKCWERYHVTCYYEHGLPEGMDSTAVIELVKGYYDDIDIIYEAYPYCYDKDWGPDMTDDQKLTHRSNFVSAYELQYNLGLLSYDGECYKIIR